MNDGMSRSYGCYCQCQLGCLCCRWAGIHRWVTAETRVGGRAHMYRLCTQRHWLGVARHADECQLQLERRATGYWLVDIKRTIAATILVLTIGLVYCGLNVLSHTGFSTARYTAPCGSRSGVKEPSVLVVGFALFFNYQYKLICMSSFLIFW